MTPFPNRYPLQTKDLTYSNEFIKKGCWVESTEDFLVCLPPRAFNNKILLTN